jgi:hypothetical protein
MSCFFTTDYQFYTCELTVVEIFKHKEKIVKLSELSEEEIIKFYHQLLKRLNLFKDKKERKRYEQR